MNLKTLVSAQGYIVEGQVPFNYPVEEGEQLVTDYYTAMQITNDTAHTILKPQWNGNEWIELATIEELETAYPPLPPIEATQLDIIESQVVYTAMMTDTLMEG